jgi:hypothetical protein
VGGAVSGSKSVGGKCVFGARRGGGGGQARGWAGRERDGGAAAAARTTTPAAEAARCASPTILTSVPGLLLVDLVKGRVRGRP